MPGGISVRLEKYRALSEEKEITTDAVLKKHDSYFYHERYKNSSVYRRNTYSLQQL